MWWRPILGIFTFCARPMRMPAFSINADAAKAMPGVRLVVTGADLVQAGVNPIPGVSGFARADGSPARSAPRYALAVGRVRFVGEPVAAIGGANAGAGAAGGRGDRRGLRLVASGGALGGRHGTKRAADVRGAGRQHRGRDAAWRRRQPAAAFAAAKHVVRLNIANQRLSALALEPRSVLYTYDAESGRLTIRMSSQMPSGLRDTVCGALNLPKAQCRVIVGDVGGGFGMKTGAYPEDVAVAFCCRALKRPVKWIADRSESFVRRARARCGFCGRAGAGCQRQDPCAAGGEWEANIGAYATGVAVAIALLIGPWYRPASTTSDHRLPLQGRAHQHSPIGAYRGAGRPEAIYVIERLMDEAARQTGIDRVELRRRNFIRPQQMPYKNPMAQVYDSGQFEQVMNQGLTLADWAGFAAREAASKQRGKWRGLGIVTFLVDRRQRV